MSDWAKMHIVRGSAYESSSSIRPRAGGRCSLAQHSGCQCTGVLYDYNGCMKMYDFKQVYASLLRNAILLWPIYSTKKK